MPVLPMCEVCYSFHLSPSQHLDVRFSSTELTEDPDLASAVLRLLTPQMLVSAWEALILEKKVLVVCADATVVPYCCEFLRRLVLPLTVVTFVPLLPRQTLTAIEAPFPYLVGGCSSAITDMQIDLSETVLYSLFLTMLLICLRLSKIHDFCNFIILYKEHSTVYLPR
jgi:hypothetical protein